jgi:hypothetical protein
LLDVDVGVIVTDKVFDAVTKLVDVVLLPVASVALTTCNTLPVGNAAFGSDTALLRLIDDGVPKLAAGSGDVNPFAPIVLIGII